MTRCRERFLLPVFCLITGLLGACPPAVGQEQIIHTLRGRLNRLEQPLFADGADGTLKQFSLFEAALIASGVDRQEQVQRYQARLTELVKDLQQTGRLKGSARKDAESVFQFLHNRVLRGGYRLAATDLRQALDHGRYNCVSATVLFICLARQVDVPCCGLETPGHAFCRVFLPEGTLRVETTCPRWFALAHDPDRQARAVEKILGSAPCSKQATIRQVTPIQLTAMIYYNRGVDFLRENRYAEAAAVNAKALTLDPQNHTARGNLLATINNWSIALGSENRFAEAADLLRRGMAWEAKYAPFAQNFAHVHHQWSAALCREGRYAEASSILTTAAGELPDQEFIRRELKNVYRRWAEVLIAAGVSSLKRAERSP